MIRNFYTASKQLQEKSHDGSGSVDLYEIWQQADFASNIDFCDRVVIPPGSSVGYHQHGNNEELYILLAGEGLMTIDEKETVVSAGDMILNPPGGRHGLINNSDESIDLLVIQVSIKQ